MTITVIVLAGGSGKRMGDGKNKLLKTFQEKTILELSMRELQKHPRINNMVFVRSLDHASELDPLVSKFSKVF